MSKTDKKSTPTPAVKETTKEPVTIDQLIDQAAGNFYTVEHLNRSAERLHDLSQMLDEGKESPHFGVMTQGLGSLIDFYADEIESCTGYFAQIVEKGGALKTQREQGGAA
jgi:hypothetical protein